MADFKTHQTFKLDNQCNSRSVWSDQADATSETAKV